MKRRDIHQTNYLLSNQLIAETGWTPHSGCALIEMAPLTCPNNWRECCFVCHSNWGMFSERTREKYCGFFLGLAQINSSISVFHNLVLSCKPFKVAIFVGGAWLVWCTGNASTTRENRRQKSRRRRRKIKRKFISKSRNRGRNRFLTKGNRRCNANQC